MLQTQLCVGCRVCCPEHVLEQCSRGCSSYNEYQLQAGSGAADHTSLLHDRALWVRLIKAGGISQACRAWQ